MKQKYEIEVAENGYLVKFTGSSIAASTETFVFTDFSNLETFVKTRLQWIEKTQMKEQRDEDDFRKARATQQ